MKTNLSALMPYLYYINNILEQALLKVNLNNFIFIKAEGGEVGVVGLMIYR